MFVSTQGTQDNTDLTDQGNDGENAKGQQQDCINIHTVTISEIFFNLFKGAKEGSKQENSISEDPTSGKPFSGDRPKKSVLCVIL